MNQFPFTLEPQSPPEIIRDRLLSEAIIQNSAGPNMLLWGNDTFLFAIVVDLSNLQLESLAATLEVQSSDRFGIQNL